jgi:hypothetical protein
MISDLIREYQTPYQDVPYDMSCSSFVYPHEIPCRLKSLRPNPYGTPNIFVPILLFGRRGTHRSSLRQKISNALLKVHRVKLSLQSVQKG